MAIRFTNSQLVAIAYVSWGAGVSPHELAEDRKMKLSNCLTEIVDPLVSTGIFYYGEPRRTGKPGRPPKKLYLTDNEYVLRDIRFAIESNWKKYVEKSEKHDKSYNRVKDDALKYKIFRYERELILNKIQLWNNVHGLFEFGVFHKKTGRLPVYGYSDVVFNPPEIVHSPEYAEYLKMGGV